MMRMHRHWMVYGSTSYDREGSREREREQDRVGEVLRAAWREAVSMVREVGGRRCVGGGPGGAKRRRTRTGDRALCTHATPDTPCQGSRSAGRAYLLTEREGENGQTDGAGDQCSALTGATLQLRALLALPCWSTFHLYLGPWAFGLRAGQHSAEKRRDAHAGVRVLVLRQTRNNGS